MLPGFGNTGGTGKYQITTGANSNGNGLNTGLQINLSPEQYFFVNSSTLYVTDSGDGKQTSANSSIGNGGLQKWSLVAGSWVLDYTLHNGLNLVLNTNTSGTTGLLGLTGKVIGADVELFATNYTAGDLDQTYLFGITDDLSATLASQVSGEAFSILATAPADSNFKEVSFAPTPEPGTLALIGTGIAGLLAAWRRRLRL
jgi:PEP-CTERM motif